MRNYSKKNKRLITNWSFHCRHFVRFRVCVCVFSAFSRRGRCQFGNWILFGKFGATEPCQSSAWHALCTAELVCVWSIGRALLGSCQLIPFKIFKWVDCSHAVSSIFLHKLLSVRLHCHLSARLCSTHESCWYASIVPFDKTLIETSPLLRSKRFEIFYICSLFSVAAAAAAVQTYYIVYVLLNRSHSAEWWVYGAHWCIRFDSYV